MQKKHYNKTWSAYKTLKMRRGDMYEEKYIMYYIVYDITECMQFKSNEIIEGYSNCEEYYSDGFQRLYRLLQIFL